MSKPCVEVRFTDVWALGQTLAGLNARRKMLAHSLQRAQASKKPGHRPAELTVMLAAIDEQRIALTLAWQELKRQVDNP